MLTYPRVLTTPFLRQLDLHRIPDIDENKPDFPDLNPAAVLVGAAAKLLGMSFRQLRYRIKKLGLE
ncbi:MAG: helix-turn-helix domain-containing protein [Gammaproteobacteria bacterium]